MIKQKLVYLIGSAFVIGGLLSGCAAVDESAPEKDTQTEVEQEVEENTEEKTVKKEKEQVASEEVKANDNVIEVSAFEMGYTPPTITLEKGKEYELVMTNDGEIFHDLTEKELDVEITYMSEMADHPEGTSYMDTIEKLFGVKKAYADTDADADHVDKSEEKPSLHMNADSGQTVKIKFIPKETGEFEFYCSLPGHKEAGMVGKFIVE